MAQLKVRLGFQAYDWSWSESYYYVPGGALADAKTDTLAMVNLRIMMLGGGVRLRSVFLSDDVVHRDSLYIDPPAAPDRGIYNPALLAGGIAEDNLTDFPYSILRVRREMGPTNRGIMYLAGSPDKKTYVDKDGIIWPIWVTAFQNWRNLMISGKWGSKILDVSPANTKSITFIAPVSGVYTIPQNGYVAGDKVKISQAKTLPLSGNPNGIFQVKSVSGDDVTFVNAPVNVLYLSGGKATKRTYNVVPFSNLIQNGFSSRKRGASLFLRRGRKRNRKKV